MVISPMNPLPLMNPLSLSRCVASVFDLSLYRKQASITAGGQTLRRAVGC